MAAVTSFIQNITAPLLKNKKSNSNPQKSSRKKSVKHTQRRKPQNSPNKYIEDENFTSDNIGNIEVMSTSLSENPFKYNWSISNFSKKVDKIRFLLCESFDFSKIFIQYLTNEK